MNDRVTEDRHRAYLDKAKADLNELDAQIALLRAKAENQAATARIEYGKALQDLRNRREDIGSRLRGMQAASGDAWNDLQGGLERAMASLRDGMRNAVARFQ